MATSTTNTGEETPGRIFIKDLPEGHADYDSWRYSLCAQVLRASPDLALALTYLRELEDESVAFADLPTMLDPSMNRADVSLLAAIVGACQQGIKAAEHLKTIQARAAFGCGAEDRGSWSTNGSSWVECIQLCFLRTTKRGSSTGCSCEGFPQLPQVTTGVATECQRSCRQARVRDAFR